MRTLGRLVLDAFALVLIALALVMLSGRVAVQPVLSGSMTGYADRGDLVVGIVTDATSLHVGDVILFAPPAPYGTPGGHPVAHRVHTIETRDGIAVATTKGDANPQPDPWTLDLTRTRTAEVRVVLPNAGWPFIRLSILTTPAGRMATGLGLMATGAVILLVGRRRSRRSDEAWPPPFEGEALEARLLDVQGRYAEGDPLPVDSRYGPAPAPAEAPAPVEAPAAVEVPVPAEAPVPAEVPVPAHALVQSEAPAPALAAGSDATGRHRRLIPRQRSRATYAAWSAEEALAHSPIE
jgi:signal peptidase